MVNTGAVSRGQFGQVAVPAVAEVAPVQTNNAYISQSPVKQEVREHVEKDDKSQQQRQNNKKRKHKEQREQHHQSHEQQHQVHEEVVQLSRQEQRELKRQQKRQQQQDQQHQNNDVQQTENVVPRRDRNNQQRPNRPNRHRDPSVLNENQNTPAPVVVDEKQVKVDVIDAPKHDVMNTALIINVDQGQSEIVALTPERQVERVEPTPAKVAPESTPAPVAEEKAVVAEAKNEAQPTEQAAQPQIQRASNDPRMRRRQQREAKQAKAAAPSIAPSQIPTLAQHTIGSLIRHVYGEDCTVLIEQFGLVPTFNRALQKFAEQYASTLVVEVTSETEEKKPVTRDAELPSHKPAEEAEPAPVLPLTPSQAPTPRVANDPRERRRLAKLAAEQAFEQVKQQHSAQEEVVTPTPVAEETVATAPAETQATAEPEQQPLELNQSTEVAQPEAAPVEEKTTEKVAEAPVAKEPAPSKAASKAKAAPEETAAPTEAAADAETEDSKADKDKPSRPRRPRGRPPKKANPVAE